MSALLARAVRPRTRLVIIGLWLVAIFACFAFNLPGKFSDAERNESSSYLPSDAESTRALEATKKLTEGEQAAMVIVYRREGGLTAEDRRQIASDVRRLNRAATTRSSSAATAWRSAWRPCRRTARAALVTANMTSDGESETIADPVDDARDIVGKGDDGLEIRVTGPGRLFRGRDQGLRADQRLAHRARRSCSCSCC